MAVGTRAPPLDQPQNRIARVNTAPASAQKVRNVETLSTFVEGLTTVTTVNLIRWETCTCMCTCLGPVPQCPNPTCTSGGYFQCNSPIVVDTTGKGFLLTDPQNGVIFDLWGKGTPERFAWTAPASGNAWLALDRNGNGIIDDGTELFGSSTLQAPLKEGETANGFRALAEFDLKQNGGHEDGVIDDKDAIYSKLLLWEDRNQNGISEPCELRSLREAGISRIDLYYKPQATTDSFGNVFLYKARMWDNAGHHDGKFIWDVYLGVEIMRN